MNTEHCKTLNRLFEDGYLIMIQNSGHELDEQVTMIENMGTEEEPDWEIKTDEHTYGVEDLYLNEVRVYARVDWMGILNEDNYPHPMIDSDTINPCLQSWNDDLDNAYDEAGD